MNRAVVLYTLCACLFVMGCATGAATKDSVSTQTVGEPPRGDEAQHYPLPSGPPVLVQTSDEQPQTTSDSTPKISGASHHLVVSAEELQRFLARGPSYVLNWVKIEASEQQNYRVRWLHPAVGELIGNALQEGDVIVRLHGQPLTQPDDLYEIWHSAASAKQIVLVISRDGEERQLVWDVEK